MMTYALFLRWLGNLFPKEPTLEVVKEEGNVIYVKAAVHRCSA